jgi:hypothetical protein
VICGRDQQRQLRHFGTTGKSENCCQAESADAIYLRGAGVWFGWHGRLDRRAVARRGGPEADQSYAQARDCRLPAFRSTLPLLAADESSRKP